MNNVNLQEIEHFQKDSAHWWDEDGPFKPLHKLNPVRISYIKQQICSHFGRNTKDLNALKGLSVLDVGCGGGLVCEPLARLGGDMTGLDADTQAIGVAKDHAKSAGLDIDYRAETAEKLLNEKARFDVVLALEIIEHVTDAQSFVKTICALVKPGGLVIFSTLNRTPKSYALGIIAAEYILGWVPKGTHDWNKFIKPSELTAMIRQAGAQPLDLCGLTYSPFRDEFKLNKRDPDVNYFLSCSAA